MTSLFSSLETGTSAFHVLLELKLQTSTLQQTRQNGEWKSLQGMTLIEDALTAGVSRLFCKNEYSRYSIMGPNSLASLGICILRVHRHASQRCSHNWSLGRRPCPSFDAR